MIFGKKICQWCVQHEAAQRGDDSDNEKQVVLPAPWVRREQSSGITLTQILFGANIAVFLAMALASGSALDFPGETMVRFGANFGPYTLSGEWWRLFTYMFLHGGIMHIAFNMWCLWDLGALSESLYGRWTFLAIYLLTGVAGGLASVGWNPGVLSVGASGAIFGLAGALIASFYLGEFSLPNIAIRGTLRSLVIFAVFNLFFGGLFGGIDNACHIGGLVCGLIAGALIAKVAPQHDRPMQRAGVLLLVLFLVGSGALGVQKLRGSSMQYGRAMMQARQNAERTISDLEKKAKQNPQDVSTHYNLARAYFNVGRIGDGETELQRVLQLQPQDTRARTDLGAAYLSQGQAKQAQEEFAKLVAQEPNNVDGHTGLGIALADQDNHSGAIDEYKNALRVDANADGVNYRMGVSQAKLKQYDDAIASFLKERDSSGDNAALESGLAEAYEAKGMKQEAQDAQAKAAQLKHAREDQ
jgi:rhomboid protease GluP